MLSFASSFSAVGSNGLPRRSDSLNATQQTAPSHPIFLKVEEELHDARRVHSHGQEEDLRAALNMVINRVSHLSNLLSEAYKTQADLEVQLNVAKSNLQLVIANNEMLEEALKRGDSGNSRDLGWRRWSAKEGEQREQKRSSDERPRHSEHSNSVDSVASAPPTTLSTPGAPTSSPSITPPADTRFFKFRFANSASNSRQGSRPTTPSPILPQGNAIQAGLQHGLSSPSQLSLQSEKLSKEVEELAAQLEKERLARKQAKKDKEALEAEIESLSQALFEEANKMVAHERIKRAETEEELKEATLEKEALRSALRLIEGENRDLRSSSSSLVASASESSLPLAGDGVMSTPKTRARSSSAVGVKSLPSSPRGSTSPPSSPPPHLSHSAPLSRKATHDSEGDTDTEGDYVQVVARQSFISESQQPTPQDLRFKAPPFEPASPQHSFTIAGPSPTEQLYATF
ncbi:hypothetical protein BDN72DRAFT_900852 [Pluteus cervinus]|uniref:Uncharacterized protein n=1 Tax=Pluteus cervinus TaxID=181527 RepID=A0ACD3AIH3_9AGAR|nr:hypothetical protein BDN72DRAFT_900852 [Pluteus cervinus]